VLALHFHQIGMREDVFHQPFSQPAPAILFMDDDIA
jgi:hypothetical protein